MSDLIRLSLTTVNAPDAEGEWRLHDVRDVLLHVITETACHAGHLDAVRELIDGQQGLGVQMHLEFFVDDLEVTGARVLAAGATRFEHQPNADHCFVYADPAGHPFCLSMWGAPRVGD